MTDSEWDVVVIGGGPAGLAAALMLGRSRRRVLVIDAGSPRNRFAAHMHGVLGNEGTAPAELLARGRAEVAEFGVRVIDGAVNRVELTEPGVRVVAADGASHQARAVLVATGLTDELPAVPGLASRWGSTVLHCPYCHGWEVRDRSLGVLLTSPMAVHQAQLVRQLSDRVTVFTAGVEVDEATRHRLRSRGVRLVDAAVTEIVGDGDAIEAVRTADGGSHPVDALFTASQPRTHEDFLAGLDLARTETPFGSFLAVDQAGKTSNDRIWATGNVASPMANVPMSIGAGTMAGAALNGALVEWDFDRAVQATDWPEVAPVDFWEERYGGAEPIWSGRVNHSFAALAEQLAVGTALEFGCGEGADAIWLARRGWQVTAVDISPTAIRRAGEAATAAGLSEQVRFVAADLATWTDDDSYDLVTASFLHSPVEFDRTAALRKASEKVRDGGHLLVVSHAAPPPWADLPPDHHHLFAAPADEVEALALDPAEWTTVLAEVRRRPATGPDGQEAMLDDGVILLRRKG
ncbi:MAG: bifunctional NAD(P)/FAD-dependent oxidoreductase/class I SAM-dependent methyltransferase [Micropruina sp.]|uniref:FAD-dependent oxidoreductase n=1 Tax=Micropruina sp. TaxID=2737536 RepID=UPI0039E5EAC0